MAKKVDWKQIICDLGFLSVRQMLYCFYVEQNKSIRQIHDIIGVGPSIILKALILNKIEIRDKRSTGSLIGKRPGYFICRYCRQKIWGDVRNVCCDDPICRDKHLKYERQEKYRSAQKNEAAKKRSNNHCKICGKDKGRNYFFCSKCLSLISAGNWTDRFL